MKKILLSLLYSIAIVGIGFIVYLEISSRIDHVFGFKPMAISEGLLLVKKQMAKVF